MEFCLILVNIYILKDVYIYLRNDTSAQVSKIKRTSEMFKIATYSLVTCHKTEGSFSIVLNL